MSVTDAEVGITEYATACRSFTGILKHRYRDFQVNEVDLQGNVAHLTQLQPPASAEPQQRSGPALVGDELLLAAPALATAFAEIAGPHNAQLLQQLLHALASRTAPSARAAALPAPAHDPTPPIPGSSAPSTATSTGGAAATDIELPALTDPDPAAADPSPAVSNPAAADPSPSASAPPAADPSPAVSTPAAADPSPAVSTPAATELHSSITQLPNGGLQLLLDPIDNKETRRAVHDFFRNQCQLPPMSTEAETKTKAEPQGGPGAGADAGAGAEQQGVRIRVRWHPAGAGSAEAGGGRGGGRGGGGGRGQKRSRDDAPGSERRWEGGSSKYTHFVMYKENMDSQMAVGLLATSLRLAVNVFGYAGTKDKRGVTSQFMTAFKVEPRRLAALNPRLRGVRVGDFGFRPQQLQLGALSGNEFRLLMREVALAGAPQAGEGTEAAAVAEAALAEACSRVADTGFINYFGLQRFGTGGAPTHKIGAALLRGEYEAAVRMIMSGRPGEKPEVAAARAPFLQRGDARGSLRLMPRWATAERAILEVLARKQEAGPGLSPALLAPALRAIPRTLRMMYMHAYQSYLWNLAASHRVRVHGIRRVVAGDLVLRASEVDGGGGGPDMDVDQAGVGAEPVGGAGEEEAGLGLGSSRKRLAAVHVVSESEAAAGVWSIHDVVLPVPGSKVQYPQHSTAEVYFKTAADDGVTVGGEHVPKAEAGAEGVVPPACSTGGTPAPEVQAAAAAPQDAAATPQPRKAEPASVGQGQGRGQGSSNNKGADVAALKSLRQEFSLASLTGDYRHVVLRPKGFEWALLRYKDPNDDSLVLTELEQLMQQGGAGAEGDDASRGREQSKRQRTEAQGEGAGRPENQARGYAGEQDGGVADQQLAAAAPVPGADHEQHSVAEGAVHLDATQPASAQTQAEGQDGAGALPLLALKLRFQLPASCYATMLIRELTKQSTQKDFQAVLSGYVSGQGKGV